MSKSNNKTAILLLGAALAIYAGTVSATDAAHDWLMKMSQAAQDLNYRGHFVYQHNGQMEAMQIIHRSSNGAVQERLLSLNGSPREIIRNQQGVWCYLPDEKSIVVSHRNKAEKNFPALIPMRLDQLDPYYRFKMGRKERVSGRLTQKVLIAPRDKYRYGYRLWADTATGLLLKADLVDARGAVLEQFMFTDISIGGDIPKSELRATVDTTGLVMHKPKSDPSPISGSRKWQFRGLPKGFKQVSYQQRMKPMSDHSMTHIVLSDGLAAISVFIEPFDAKIAASHNSMGAVNVWRAQLYGNQITAVGEVPAITVKKIAKAAHPDPG
ncbi:MAG: MucB/RseB C-terminal domain-containing protein [Proteobacteria bacterium]|nr:MucB/RseB C-terminal domain-containing protein [Pseudomonadota bacterium]